ncbi:MAG: transcriptional repressor [Phycisphaerae bacterium]|nr:transcriptional repressor [Phycisphaerae bacterium]
MPDPDPEIIEPLCAVFRRTLRGEGLKYTPERAAVLDTIVRLDGLFEADSIIEKIKGGGFRVSKATVYRTIKLLQQAGIIQAVLLDSEQTHYQLVYGRRPQELVIRVDTGAAETVHLPEVAAVCESLCRERGLVLKGHRLHIFAVGADDGGR